MSNGDLIQMTISSYFHLKHLSLSSYNCSTIHPYVLIQKNVCSYQAAVSYVSNIYSKFNHQIQDDSLKSVYLKDREEEEAVKDKIPLSTFQLQENGQCKHSIVDPLRQDPCSISQCTPPSLNIDSTISLVAYNKLQTFMY